jgi:hypothetical protein
MVPFLCFHLSYNFCPRRPLQPLYRREKPWRTKTASKCKHQVLGTGCWGWSQKQWLSQGDEIYQVHIATGGELFPKVYWGGRFTLIRNSCYIISARTYSNLGTLPYEMMFRRQTLNTWAWTWSQGGSSHECGRYSCSHPRCKEWGPEMRW